MESLPLVRIRQRGFLSLFLFISVPLLLPAQEVFFDLGSDWKFFRGKDVPSAPDPAEWRTAGFEDEGWESGPTSIGYGDGDDATVLDDMQGEYFTVYTRKTFEINDLGAISSLLLSIDYDDGFVCYINGVEALRVNAGNPGDELAFDDFATGQHEAGNLEFFDLPDILDDLLVGENLIAVEIHNATENSSDLTFNARLSANDPRGSCPANLACARTPESVTLSWDAPVEYSSVAVTRDGEHILGSPFSGDTTSVVDGEPGDFSNLYEVVATIDGFNCEPLTCSTDPQFTFIGDDEEWRFFRGKTAPSDPPTAWRETGFDDSQWELGQTGIGYGDGDDVTILDDMRQMADDPDTPEVDESQPGYLSVYCRKDFRLADPAFVTNLFLEIDYDDGFIAYLNGAEVARSGNMGNPGEEFSFDQPAGGNHNAGTPATYDLTSFTGELRQGDNVLAVEIHNVNLTSSDLSFIPTLTANECFNGLTCDYDLVADEVTLSWDAIPADFISVTRNGEHIEGSPFPGDTSLVIDSSPGGRDNEYEVVANIGGFECAAETCDFTCSDRRVEDLTCELSLVGGITQAQLSWSTPPGATAIEIRREGTLLATLAGDVTEYLDEDVESEEPEEDTDYDVIFQFEDGGDCTLECGASLCPGDVTCEAIDVGGIYRARISWGNMVKEWESFTILRDGEEIAAGVPGDSSSFTDNTVELLPGDPLTYEVTPVPPQGEEPTPPCAALTCSVAAPLPEIGEYQEPAGGWDYRIDFDAGQDQYNPAEGEPGNLDGNWVRVPGFDSWDGSAPGETGDAPAGEAPGGVEVEILPGEGPCGGDIGVLRILDPGDPTNPGADLATEFPDPYDEPNNRAIFLGFETGIADRNLLRDGVTLAARWRVNPSSPAYLDPQPSGDGSPITAGRGQVGLYFLNDGSIAEGGATAGLSFSLQSGDILQMSTDPTSSLVAADIDTFWNIWVTVEDPEGDDTYNINLYVNGREAPLTQFGTGTEVVLDDGDVDLDGVVGNFLGIGIPVDGNDADIQIDSIAYKAGVHPPLSAPCSPCTNNRPAARMDPSATTVTLPGSITLDGTASDDGDGGVQGLDYQWTKLSGPAGDNIASPGGSSTEVTFAAEGTYQYQLLVDDGESCDNVATATVSITVQESTGEPTFRRGDTDGNGIVELTDVIRALTWQFVGGVVIECQDAADLDDDGQITLTDAIRSLNYQFVGLAGTTPESPGPLNCGPDVNADSLPECVYPDCP